MTVRGIELVGGPLHGTIHEFSSDLLPFLQRYGFPDEIGIQDPDNDETVHYYETNVVQNKAIYQFSTKDNP